MRRQANEEDAMNPIFWTRWDWAVWGWHHPWTLLITPAIIAALYVASKLKDPR